MKSELTLPWIGMKPQHILGGIVGLACLAIWCAVSVTADHADSFDADVAIATGELKQLVPALLGALGGKVAAS